jgi:hypothetical protein
MSWNQGPGRIAQRARGLRSVVPKLPGSRTASNTPNVIGLLISSFHSPNRSPAAGLGYVHIGQVLSLRRPLPPKSAGSRGFFQQEYPSRRDP